MKHRRSLGIACLVLFASATLSAHHSITAYYDTSREVTLKGPVAKIEWTNPHAFVHVEVRDEHGAATSWAVETDSPNVLNRGGWTRDTLHIDDVVTVIGYPSKKGTPAIRLVTLMLADGHKLKG